MSETPEKLKALLVRSERLPTLPVVALKILEMVKKDDVSVREMETVISHDPPLAAKVLRIINSPFYSLPRKVTSVRQAISLLGINSVKNLALGFSLVKNNRTGTEGFDYRNFWKRSIIGAVAAKLLAQQAPGFACEDCFFLGLLQDIGVLALNQTLPQPYGEALRLKREKNIPLSEAEREVLGFDHAEAGSFLIEHWGLPATFHVPIRHHHTPDRTDNPALLPLTRLLAMSSAIADFFSHERPLQALETIRAAARRQNMEQQIDLLMIQVFSESVNIGEIFEMDMSRQRNYAEILEEAQAELDKSSLQMQKMLLQQTKENEQLKDQVIRDGLTGLHNYRCFHELLERELDRALRYRRPLTLVLGDIDHFKTVNDTFGHQMGDQVLAEIAGVFREELRKSDFVARYGGEEFALLLVETDMDSALPIVERLRERVAALRTAQGGQQAQVTISFGLTALDQQAMVMTKEELIRLADEALYEAKRSGRNRCCVRLPNPQKVVAAQPQGGTPYRL